MVFGVGFRAVVVFFLDCGDFAAVVFLVVLALLTAGVFLAFDFAAVVVLRVEDFGLVDAFLAEDVGFFAVDLARAVVFLAVDFLDEDFARLDAFFAVVAFLAAGFLELEAFLAVDLLAVDFLAVDFLAVDFFVVDFLAVEAFFAAGFERDAELLDFDLGFDFVLLVEVFFVAEVFDPAFFLVAISCPPFLTKNITNRV